MYFISLNNNKKISAALEELQLFFLKIILYASSLDLPRALLRCRFLEFLPYLLNQTLSAGAPEEMLLNKHPH